jgi:hypothetical protein
MYLELLPAFCFLNVYYTYREREIPITFLKRTHVAFTQKDIFIFQST